MIGGWGRLPRDWRPWLLATLTAGFALAAIFVPAIPQPLSYHAFADCRTFWAVPNFFNGSITQGCSNGEASTRFARPASPKIARLFASVAPLVKITSSG